MSVMTRSGARMCSEVNDMRMETQRLVLREYTMEEFDGLREILSDPQTMRYYPRPYDDDGVRKWLHWSMENYRTFGFGLWALILKENGKMIGDCGVTMQTINGKIRPEIGYHINRAYQGRGYATEAARRCKDFVFENTPFNAVYSYMNAANVASYTVAMKNGMRLVEEYDDPEDGALKVYAITRDEWERKNV